MDDARRVKVPFAFCWWRLHLLIPAIYFGYLAVVSLKDFFASPLSATLLGGLWGICAFAFARQLWRERYPFEWEVRTRGDAGRWHSRSS